MGPKKKLTSWGQAYYNASMREFLAKRGGIVVLRSRHAEGKLRFQLHITKGRAIKQECLDAVHELILDAVGGEAGLTDCPIGPLARHYIGEIRTARAWPPADASPRELNLHLSKVWKSVETAVGESDLIRSERKNPPPWLVEDFEAGL